MKKIPSKTISACFDNGKKLLEDAKLLFDWDRFSTALALSILAQEEFAKAFLLELVADDALPWLAEVQRSIARHQCKHLLGVIMEWLPPFDVDRLREQMKKNTERHERWMAWAARRSERHKQNDFSPDADDPEPVEEEFFFPVDVATALNIYRHEEIERLGDRYPWKDIDWSTGRARKIADGSLDRKKQPDSTSMSRKPVRSDYTLGSSRARRLPKRSNWQSALEMVLSNFLTNIRNLKALSKLFFRI